MVRLLACGRLLLAAGVLLLVLRPAQAQTLSDGWKALDDAFTERSNYALVRDLFRGNVDFKPEDTSHVTAVDLKTKVVTYQVFLRHLEDTPGGMEKVFNDFIGDLDSISKYKLSALANVYRDKVRQHALELIEHNGCRVVHRIYGARVLARLPELAQPELADTLVKVLKDGKQSPAVHFFVLRGLRELLALPAQMPPVINKDRETACAEGIIEILERKPLISPGASDEEIDGFRMFRREGVRALAQIHTPKLKDKVRPALVLARFAGADAQVVPPPRIDERMEAAVGLARMQPDPQSGFQADYAALQIARALGVFAEAYSRNREARGQNRLRPWAIDSLRLQEALSVLKNTAKQDKFVADVVGKGQRVLRVIERSGEVQAGDLGWFTDPANEPPSKELLKGDADSAVKPGSSEGEK